MPRGTRESCGSQHLFTYGAITLYCRFFQIFQLKCRFVTPRWINGSTCMIPQPRPYNTHQLLRTIGLGCSPFARHYLGNRYLLSLPGGTEMVHFPPFASRLLFYSETDDTTLLVPGCPIRKSPGQSQLAANRGLSQLATSFIAFLRQGIHRVPLVA